MYAPIIPMPPTAANSVLLTPPIRFPDVLLDVDWLLLLELVLGLLLFFPGIVTLLQGMIIVLLKPASHRYSDYASSQSER